MAERKIKKIEVGLPPINTKRLVVEIKGVSPLLMDRFPESVKEAILAKQSGISKGNKKLVRDITQECEDAVHITSKGNIGFPIYAFKKGMMECTSFLGDKMFSKKLVSGAIKIMNGEDGLILLKYGEQDTLKHTIGNQTKFTPQFHNWECELDIKYDANNISASDIITLINYAGFYQGIGAWRPKGRDGGSGEYGMYEVKIK